MTGSFLFAFSIFIYYQSGFIAQTSIESAAYGPSFYPRVLSIIMMVFAIILALYPNQDNIEIKDKSILPNKTKVKTIILMLALLVLYPIITPLIGFVITTILFLTISFYYFGGKKSVDIFKYLIISISMALVIYYIFETFFYVFLPHGVIF